VIALDLSRLLSRAGSATPSGIDRVELAYAKHLLAGKATHCFAARHALGGIGLLPAAPTEEFVGRLAAMWRDGAPGRERRAVAALARRLRLTVLTNGPTLRRVLRDSRDRAVYLVVSHQNLDRPRPISRLKATTGARFVCLIHDLIPLDVPHLTRPSQTARHRKRIAAVAALGDAAIVNSADTRDALSVHLGDLELPVVVAPLGVDLPRTAAPPADAIPYFVCLGTIEARKNQVLLLEIWRRLAAERGGQTPPLLLVGQCGYGGERVVNRLGTLPGVMIERLDMPDKAMAALLRGTRALLLPSLAEGFGLPVAEALSLGVPVLCSDLPALRESGCGVPDYLDPYDAAAWHAAIVDFISDSSRRQAQLARLEQWLPPLWSAHFALVDQLIAGLP
jgi:glycosyltransferase involved in cell wall biosynthesis